MTTSSFIKIVLLLSFSATLAHAAFGGHGSKHPPDAEPTPIKNKIFGECSIIAGNGNMLGGPCANIVITLNVGEGKDILNTRSTAQGYFEFNAPLAENYKIGVGSRLYEVVNPKESVQLGQKIELELRQK